MKKANGIKLLTLAGLMATAACTGDFLNKNTNPDQATDEMLSWDNLSTGSAFAQMTKNVIPSFQLVGDKEYGSANYQVIEDLAGNIFAGYTGVINTSFTGNNLYNVTGKDWYNAMFNDAYTRVISAWNQLDPQRGEFPEVVALADIVKVAAMHRVTDTYGPIPYLNISSGDINKAYDPQQAVYKRFFEELDAAITTLTAFYEAQPGTKLLEAYDNVFSGNVSGWIKFANTLRLRLAMARGLCRRGAGPRAGCGRHRQSGRPDDRRRRPRGAAQTRHRFVGIPALHDPVQFRRLAHRRHDRSLHERLSGPAPRQVLRGDGQG